MTVPFQPVYLFADSQLLYWSARDQPTLHAAREAMGKERPKAAYVGASNGDDPQYYAIFEGAMDRIGIHDRRMILSDYSPEDQSYLNDADLILLAGGDVTEGLQVLQETGMGQDIRMKYYNGATVVGVSAGAVQLGIRAWRADDPDEDDIVDALGLVPYVVDVHDEENRWHRLKTVVSLSPNNTRGFALPTGGGAIHHPDVTIEPLRHPLTGFQLSDTRVIETLLLPPDGTEEEPVDA